QGRKSAATNFLLWQAIEILKERGIDWFDLGGIHPDAAPGLTHFKSGL
ncbi:MAG TPA: GNAT family N-acetyltransferase, partial [Alphaproteobacteria bacterium]|nr:GNAT family N-acetyltransferase [Alphaproteobacteria bacterium]